MSAKTASPRDRAAGVAARAPGVADVADSFAEVWQRYGEAWEPLRRALEEAAAAHGVALGQLEADGLAVGGEAGDMPVGERACASYRERVAGEALDPLRAVVSGAGLATELEAALHAAQEDVFTSLPELGPAAGRHLERVVLPGQRRAFKVSQRRRGRWLGDVERAWHEWVSVVLAPASDDAAGQEGADPGGSAAAYLAAGAALQTALDSLAEQVGSVSASAAEEMRERPGTVRAAATAAGRLVAEALARRSPDQRDAELAGRWDDWAEEAAARLALYCEFLALRSDIDALRSRLVRDWRASASGVEAVLDAFAAELAAGRERARLLGDRAGSEAGATSLLDALEAERQRTTQAVGRAADALPAPADLLAELTGNAEETIASLPAAADALSEALTVHDVPGSGDRLRSPGRDSRTVQLREAARQAFDTLRIERIRAAPAVIEEAMLRIGADVAQLCEVVAYGYQAAIAELSEGGDTDSGEQVGPVTVALSRAEDRAGEARHALREAMDRTEARMNREVAAGFQQLVGRVLADRLRAGYLEARSYLATEVTEDLDRLRGRAADVGRRASGGLRAVRSRLQPLAAVLGMATRAPADAAGRTLAMADEVVRSLPVVYRRLFAFEPLTDPRLLAGRNEALADLSAMWERREQGDCRSLLVVAAPGCGTTSFLNIAAARLSAAAGASAAHSPEVRGAFRQRVRDEDALVAQLAGWLDIDGVKHLDGLAEVVLEAPPRAVPGVVILEGLEHLHMRVQGGARLLERFLTFMSRTESRIFWVVGVSSSAWQLIERRSPPFVSDMERMVLGELSPGDLREAVLARHRLSGLPLRFAEPQRGQDALRRRARQLRGTSRQQQLVEAQYFQRLHRASQGSVRMSMFHWLRSADFDTIEGSLLVKPLENLTAFMDVLDLPQSFALKSLLDHGTLTVSEYCEVARAPETDNFHLFRSLVDLHVIEAADGGAGQGSEASVRYRIRPLMTGPVAAHLRSLNILH